VCGSVPGLRRNRTGKGELGTRNGPGAGRIRSLARVDGLPQLLRQPKRLLPAERKQELGACLLVAELDQGDGVGVLQGDVDP
jgi:hypothetical protein